MRLRVNIAATGERYRFFLQHDRSMAAFPHGPQSCTHAPIPSTWGSQSEAGRTRVRGMREHRVEGHAQSGGPGP